MKRSRIYQPFKIDRRQRGIALITVILIVAVVMALAYHLLTQHSLTISSSKLLIDRAQLREYALGGELFAREILYADWENEDTRAVDTLAEKWAEPFEPISFDGGNLSVKIYDLSARFNLNALIGRHGPDNILRFRRFLEILGLDQSGADLWLDWIDDNHEVSEFGAEDDQYLLKNTPYRTANQLADDRSELMALGVFSRRELDRLFPFVVALPTTDLEINVNTVLQPVLESLSPNFDRSEAELLIESEREFVTVEDITAEYAALGDSVAVLGVASEYFQIESRAEAANNRVHLWSLVHRDMTSGKVTLLSRDYSRKEDRASELMFTNDQEKRRSSEDL